MDNRPHGAPTFRAPTFDDLRASLRAGWQDFRAAPVVDFYFASYFVLAGLVMSAITIATGTTFWLVLAVLGFPLIGALAAIGFYETSRRRSQSEPVKLTPIQRLVWSHRGGQLPWLATIIVVVFLFWFFLGHMIFALFLGLSPMTNVSTSLDVFLSTDGLTMIGFGSIVGAVFAILVFAISVQGMPMLFDRDVDFMTALLTSIQQVATTPVVYLAWGLLIGVVTLLAMVPFFLGLFIAMPVLGHATWHLYQRVSDGG